MLKFLIYIVLFFIVSCGGETYQETIVEYTGKTGELGGQCVLPQRTCNCYPACYCEGDSFKCEPMPDQNHQDYPNDSDIIDDIDQPGPPDGWGGQENIEEG